MKLHHVIVGPVTNSSTTVYTVPSEAVVKVVKNIIEELGLDVKEFEFSIVSNSKLIELLISNDMYKDIDEEDHVDLLSPKFRIEVELKVRELEDFHVDSSRYKEAKEALFQSIKDYVTSPDWNPPDLENQDFNADFTACFMPILEVRRNGKLLPSFTDLGNAFDYETSGDQGEIYFEEVIK